MKNIRFVLLLAGMSLFVACSEEEKPKINPLVGEWDLDSFVIQNAPSAYSQSDPQTYGMTEFYENVSKITLTLNKDGTYKRDFDITGAPDQTILGTWEQKGDEFTFTPDDSDFDPVTFEIYEQDNEDQLWLSEEGTWPMVKDAIRDTITQAYLDSLNDEEYYSLFDEVTVDFITVYEKVTN